MPADRVAILRAVVARCETIRQDPPPWHHFDEAVKALAALGDAAIPDLIDALGDPDDSVTFGVRCALIAIGRNVLPFAIEALETGGVGTRQGACFILDEFAKHDRAFATSAVPTLTSAIQDTDVSVRQRAIIALAHYRGEATAAIPLLVEALTDDDRRVGEAAAFALGRIAPRSKDVADVMFPLEFSAANDPNSTVRHAAIRAIEKIQRMRGQ